MRKFPIREGILNYEEEALIINQIIEALERIDPFLNGELGKIEPADKLDGMLAYADGINWKPNGIGGKGLWRWNADTNQWILVG